MKKFLVILVIAVLVGAGGMVYYRQSNIALPSNETVVTNTEQPSTSNDPAASNQQPAHPSAPSQPPVVSRPAFIRGIIEGFYGNPWTLQQRLDMFRFMSGHDLNTYVYAPKDDPYQRSDWALPYSTTQLAAMRQLVDGAADNGIQFVYSVSPGIPSPLPHQTLTQQMVAKSISFSSTADVARLEAKIDQMRSLGVETVMLSFDDVEESLKSVDKAAYGGDYARAHVDLANKILRDERRKSPDFQLWFAPTSYYGVADNHYWQTIRSKLDGSIPVIWTGKWVLNQQISAAQASAVARLLGRKPLLWDNYPVNDYTYAVSNAPALLLGPLEHRSSTLQNALTGYIANPMIQPEASKIGLATVAEYLQRKAAYDPAAAWQRAIREANGAGDVGPLQKFCEYASKSTLNPAGRAPFAQMATAYWKTRGTAQNASAERSLRNELQGLQDLPSAVSHTVDNAPLTKEVEPWLTKLGQEGQAGMLALDYLDTDISNASRNEKRQNLLARLQTLQGNRLSIGGEIIQFVQQALQH